MRVLILDTSAFIMGFDPMGAKNSYSVHSVEAELMVGTMPYLRFRLGREKGVLTVRDPSNESRLEVERASSKTGESGFLSEADRDIVALGLDLKTEGYDPVVVSDDYGVQNLSEHLSLGYGSLANYGIVHKYNWIMICPACHRRFRVPEKICSVCGTELKRRVLSRAKVANKSQSAESATPSTKSSCRKR